MVPNRKVTLVDLPKLQEQLLGAARQYSRGSTGSLAELRRTAVEFATAERTHQCEEQRRELATTLKGFGGLSKTAANKIASEIGSTNILAEGLLGPFISGEFDGKAWVRVDIERHYWKFDGVGKLVERGVTD
jgi:hypothetical protein